MSYKKEHCKTPEFHNLTVIFFLCAKFRLLYRQIRSHLPPESNPPTSLDTFAISSLYPDVTVHLVQHDGYHVLTKQREVCVYKWTLSDVRNPHLCWFCSRLSMLFLLPKKATNQPFESVAPASSGQSKFLSKFLQT